MKKENIAIKNGRELGKLKMIRGIMAGPDSNKIKIWMIERVLS